MVDNNKDNIDITSIKICIHFMLINITSVGIRVLIWKIKFLYIQF